jgi:hypothetical protein
MASISKNFLEKIDICVKPKSKNWWIYQAILDGSSLLSISSKYLEQSDYDGNYLTSSTDALFEAFITFKNNQFMDAEEAGYLANRSGIITQYTDPQTGNVMCFTVRDLIEELDGSEFYSWLLNQASE